jgi:hypothetical protein
MTRLACALSLVLSAASTLACSDDAAGGGGAESGGGTGGSATGGSSTGGTATGGSAGASTGGSATGGSGGSGTGGSATGGSAGSGTGGSAGGGFTKRGICGQKATGTVTATTYTGTEEFYMVSQENVEEGLIDIYNCLIRFDVTRVGEAPPNCEDLEGMPCMWTHRVEVGNPTIVTNEGGVCETNSLGWNAAWMAMLDGSQSSYGYVDEYLGHDSVVMKAFGTAGMETWEVLGRASWDETDGTFGFDNRIGECRY